MLPIAPLFDPAPHAPMERAPAGGVDCHLHVFGPLSSYPLDDERSYTPGEASLEDYAVLQRRLGLERMVIVQPSVYGTDNQCTYDALVQMGDSARAIAVLPPDVDEEELAHLHRAGFRGVRFNLITGGGHPLEAVDELVPKIAPLGWHVQFFMGDQVLLDRHAWLAALPVPLVFDHFGPLQPAPAGPEQPAMHALLNLLERGNSWVKISGAYRIDHGVAPWPGAKPLALRLLEEFPERLVWGTDWPHPMPPGAMPNDGDLLDALWDWCQDDALYERVLVENPARLYGFT
ncbi:MAG: amidohydrolase family protein [Pseudomonadota bacterium]